MVTTPTPRAPIGIFDSGVGGLTVARAVIDQLPDEDIVYVGDTENAPYGPKPIAQVRRLALTVMDELVDAGVKLLVIACNSATAAVLRDARERYTKAYGIPVVEVIQPAVQRAVTSTQNGRVGVIGTEATVSSGAYEDMFAAAPQLQITSSAAPRFVEYVERGITTGDELLALAEQYLQPFKTADVDTLILGCTHYPLLAGVISYVMGESVNLVTSSESTARAVYRELVRHGLENPAGATGETPPASSRHKFMSTGDPGSFAQLAQRFLGPEVGGVTQIRTVAEQFPTGTLSVIDASGN
ncbi:MAG: glutamate racemase [Micrococcaceae bacterium]|nr:glutamate racemase [Micrococcaceae bacterium]